MTETAWEQQRGRLAAQLVENAARALDGRRWQTLRMVRIGCDRCGAKEELGLSEAEPVVNPPGWITFWLAARRQWPVTLCAACAHGAFEAWRMPPPLRLIATARTDVNP